MSRERIEMVDVCPVGRNLKISTVHVLLFLDCRLQFLSFSVAHLRNICKLLKACFDFLASPLPSSFSSILFPEIIVCAL